MKKIVFLGKRGYYIRDFLISNATAPFCIIPINANIIPVEAKKPAQPYLIQPKMEQLLEAYRNSTEHIIPRLARFYIEFEGVHPFIDGNGRTGRLRTMLLLMNTM